VQALRRGFSDGGPPPTVVIISHRLSAVRHADEIVALDAGRIVERGRHEQLLHSGGLYADLWGTEQLKKALAAPAGASSVEAADGAKATTLDDGKAA
jgi:ABC-type multidrug transport system ATPase subunit